MARFKKHEVLSTMRTAGFVPLFFNSDIDVCIEVVNACYKGGARLLEFTNRGDFAHEVFGELNKYESYLLERKHLNHHFEQFNLL